MQTNLEETYEALSSTLICLTSVVLFNFHQTQTCPVELLIEYLKPGANPIIKRMECLSYLLGVNKSGLVPQKVYSGGFCDTFQGIEPKQYDRRYYFDNNFTDRRYSKQSSLNNNINYESIS